MKIYEHTKSIANTNWWVSKLKRVFFFFFWIKMETRESQRVGDFFLLSAFCNIFFYKLKISTFCNFFFCKLKIWWWDFMSLQCKKRAWHFFFFHDEKRAFCNLFFCRYGDCISFYVTSVWETDLFFFFFFKMRKGPFVIFSSTN